MNTSIATGIFQDGQVKLDATVDWADGSRVTVLRQDIRIGITEAEWPTTAEGIAELLKWMDTFPAIEMTAEEEAEWSAARAAVREYTLRKMEQRLESE